MQPFHPQHKMWFTQRSQNVVHSEDRELLFSDRRGLLFAADRSPEAGFLRRLYSLSAGKPAEVLSPGGIDKDCSIRMRLHLNALAKDHLDLLRRRRVLEANEQGPAVVLIGAWI